MGSTNFSDLSYKDLNFYSKLLGIKKVLMAFIPNALFRAMKFQISQFEIEKAIGEMKNHFYAWPDAWQERAKTFEKLAKEKEEKFAITAKEFYLQASYLYHFAQLYTRSEDPKKKELHNKCVQCYRRAAKFFDPPLQVVKISLEQNEMMGYLRIPSKKRPPCVIMLDGADSTKEEAHYQAEAFLERGMAVFYFDGPGQGETGYTLKMTDDNYEKAVSRVLDFICNYDVNVDRIGVYGISLGGYLAVRAAAFDKRIKAAVSVSGFYRLKFEDLTVATKEAMRYMLGLEDILEIQRFVDEKMTLEGILEKVQCPLLIIHGNQDHMISRESVIQIQNKVPNAELQTYEEGVHGLANLDNIVRPTIADWMQSRLAG